MYGGAWVGAAPRRSWLGRRGVCVFVGAPRLFPAFPSWGVLCGRACWARVSAVPRPSWLGCWGVCAVLPVLCLPPPFLGGSLWRGGVQVLRFFLFFWGGACRILALWCPSLAVPVSGLVVSVLPSPLFRAALLAFFFRPSVVCVRVFWMSLFTGGRCSWLGVAGLGWVVPLCPFGGPIFGAVWVGDFAASCGVGGRFGGCGPFLRPPPLFFFSGGGLPVPSSAFLGLAHALVGIQCGLPGCCWWLRFARPCCGPMGRVGDVHVGLGAPSCRVRLWLCRLGGCARWLRVALG